MILQDLGRIPGGNIQKLWENPGKILAGNPGNQKVGNTIEFDNIEKDDQAEAAPGHNDENVSFSVMPAWGKYEISTFPYS